MVSTFKSSKKTVLIRNNYESRDAAVQLFIRDSLIGEKTSNSKYNINNEYSTIKFVNNNLVIKGASHIIGGDYAVGTNVSRKLILENTETFEQISYDIGSITNGDYKVEFAEPPVTQFGWITNVYVLELLQVGVTGAGFFIGSGPLLIVNVILVFSATTEFLLIDCDII